MSFFRLPSDCTKTVLSCTCPLLRASIFASSLICAGHKAFPSNPLRRIRAVASSYNVCGVSHFGFQNRPPAGAHFLLQLGFTPVLQWRLAGGCHSPPPVAPPWQLFVVEERPSDRSETCWTGEKVLCGWGRRLVWCRMCSRVQAAARQYRGPCEATRMRRRRFMGRTSFAAGDLGWKRGLAPRRCGRRPPRPVGVAGGRTRRCCAATTARTMARFLVSRPAPSEPVRGVLSGNVLFL